VRSGTRSEGTERDLREEVRAWLEANLAGEFARARGLGGPGREHEEFELRRAWERRLGELAVTALGEEVLIGEAEPYGLNDLQRLYLFSRADTIYAGSSEIQRNIIAERTLGLPRG
jgi:alkylation response protein AidB-like acyl-CoA dehydrogenase